MKKNELYIAPEVEVINVMVEKGFAASGFDDDNYNGNSNSEDLPNFGV